MELVLCGSGQIIHVVGGLTLRMLNYLLALCITSFYICRKHMNKDTGKILMLFVFTTCIGISLCLISDNTVNLFDDINQLSFFLMLPFMSYLVKNLDMVNAVSKTIRYSVLLMAIIYLVYIILIKFVGVIDFRTFYILMEDEGDFLFRGNKGEMFYKGFLYLAIGLLFWIKERKYFYSFLILLAIYYTMTRGFYVITILCLGLLYIACHKVTSGTIFFLLIFSFCVLLVVNYLGLFDVSENREDGDALRVLTMQQVFERITPLSLIIGHGFGCGVPVRTIHMENAFLEIFHKQGLIGLFLWSYLLYKIVVFYKHVPFIYKSIASVYMIGTVGIYVQSLFNPYLTNPIGMSFVLLSFVVCNKLSNINEDSLCTCSLSAKIV